MTASVSEATTDYLMDLFLLHGQRGFPDALRADVIRKLKREVPRDQWPAEWHDPKPNRHERRRHAKVNRNG